MMRLCQWLAVEGGISFGSTCDCMYVLMKHRLAAFLLASQAAQNLVLGKPGGVGLPNRPV